MENNTNSKSTKNLNKLNKRLQNNDYTTENEQDLGKMTMNEFCNCLRDISGWNVQEELM